MLSNTILHLTISKIVPIAPSNGLLITRDSIILSKVKKCQVIYVEMNRMHSVNHAHVSHSSVNSLIMSVKRVGVHQQRHQRPDHQLKHTRWKASFTFYFEFKPIIIFSINFIKVKLFIIDFSLKHCAFRFSRTCSLLSSPKSVLDGPDPNQDRSLNQVVGPWSWTNWGFLRTQLDSRWCLRSLPCPPLLELSCQIRAPHRNNGDSLGIIPTPQNTKDLSRDSVRVNSKITFSLQSLLLFRINLFQQKKK